MEKLKISADGRYFVKSDGTPFSWLADTAWTIPQRMKWDDVEYYMEKRKSQGFTVLQIVALDPERDVEMRSPSGEKALIDDRLDTPNESYFAYLDWVIRKAEEYGFYVLLLPVWGQLVVGDNWMGETFPKTVTEDNAWEYGRWIGARYREKNNILWCLGGDRQPIHKGTDYRNVWRKMAEGLAKGVTGKDVRYNEPDAVWDEMLLTYHACHEQETGECSTLSYWDEEEKWIRFVMIQSGHGLLPKNYEIVSREYNRKPVRPVWDGEPAYEMMPTSWPVPESFHDTWMVRRRAYWSLFAGAFGFTYGHASVWCTISEKELDQLAVYTWCQALDSEGAEQMKYVRAVLDDLQIMRCIPAQELLEDRSGQECVRKKDEDPEEELSRHIQACADPDGKFFCAYLAGGGSIDLDAEAVKRFLKIKDEVIWLWWFDPRNGKYDKEGEPEPCEIKLQGKTLPLRAPETGDGKDWILICCAEKGGIPVQEKKYHELKERKLTKVFEW